MSLHKKWLPVLKDVPKTNHEKFVAELEEKYSKALVNHNGILHFVKNTFPRLKAKYQESYVSPFTDEIVTPSQD